ncbi:MAG: hypothetical protein ACYC7E_06935 [Armatimonadota bacterium]
MKLWTQLAMLITVIVSLAPSGVQAGERKFVLREPLRKPWTHELVSVPFTAKQGECRMDSVTLTGPNGPVPVQLTQVEYWARTPFVKTARVSFLAGLAPLAEDAYVLRFAKTATPSALPTTDLQVTTTANTVTLRTGKFGITLLRGNAVYPRGMDSARVPGPVAGMQLADGTAFGGSALYGTQKITAYDARITEKGPVLAEVAIRYGYADGTGLRLTARLAAGDAQAVWSMECDGDLAKDGWRLYLTPGLAPLHFTAVPEFYENRWGTAEMIGGKWVFTPAEVDLTKEPPGFLVNMVPWDGWWDSKNKRSFTFRIPGRGDVFFIGSRDAGAWKIPAPDSDLTTFPYGDEAMRKRWVPLSRGADGALFFDFNASNGQRYWQSGTPFAPDAQTALGGMPWPAERYQRLDNLLHDYALDWRQDPKRTHPLMYVSRSELDARRKRLVEPAVIDKLIKDAQQRVEPSSYDGKALGAYLLTGDPQVAARGKVVERLRHHLELFGAFDLMRSPLVVAALYDAVIDSDLIAPDERPVLRAQMAWLAYKIADPSNWSTERGYCSGNPNMSVAHILQQGQLACLLPDHPQARNWARPALAMMDKWLHELGPEGEHVESVANYAHVSTSTMLSFAIAAKNAGLRDYVNDPRMKKLVMFLTKQYTPLDPRSGGNRKPGFSRLPPAGRGPAGQRWDMPAAMARATADSDPDYSRALQWVWQQAGRPGNTDGRFGGFEHVYIAPDLPAANPGWGSEFFPAYGAILRAGWGTPDAYYVNFQAHIGDGYPSPDGSFPAIFAKGAPISIVFNEGYIDREELLISKVLPARNRGTTDERNASFYHKQEEKISAFAALSRQDYLTFDATIKEPVHLKMVESPGHHGEVHVPAAWPPVPAKAGNAPIPWRRQLLFMKDADAAGANYLVLRDTVSGKQPTQWQFWTLSEKIGTPEETRTLETFLADKPGNQTAEPRQLQGDRFTAIGQFGVDLEYFVASPRTTPRYTLRAGEEYAFFDFCNGTSDYQDLLHLQMPGDGAYYVALFPRRRGDAAPEFATLGNGAIIKVSGDFGTDYCFLSSETIEAAAEGVRFIGTAASIQDRNSGRVLALGGKGDVRYQAYGLAADFPACLRIGAKELAVEVPEQLPDFTKPMNPLNAFGWAGRRFFPLAAFPGGTVMVTAPGEWALATPQKGVTLAKTAAGWALTVPRGVREVALTAK